MGKKSIIGGVLLGAGAVIGAIGISKNKKVQGKIGEIKESDKYKTVVTKVESVKDSEAVKGAVSKSKEVLSKSKELGEKGIAKAKEVSKNKEVKKAETILEEAEAILDGVELKEVKTEK